MYNIFLEKDAMYETEKLFSETPSCVAKKTK